jgi:hypothetical protein
MIGILPDVPPNVAGFRASGEVTREDYKNIVYPEIRRHVETFGHLNFVFFVDTSLKNFSVGAWIRDIWLSLKEMARWHRVAIISDVEKVRNFTDTISRLLPGEYRGFPASRLEEAIRWAASEESSAPQTDLLPGYIEALLPPQVVGTTTTISAQVVSHREDDARSVFERAADRLMDVNQWTDHCGVLSASFQLADETGEPLQGHATKDDFVRIDIPNMRDGDGRDWVRIEKIEQPIVDATDGIVLVQLRPSPAPPVTAGAPVAHFLEGSATRTLVVERKGKVVTATAFGRNEVPNKSHPGITDLSRTQLKALVQGLLEKA